MKAFAGSIVGVWVDMSSGRPVGLMETEDGHTFSFKLKQVHGADRVFSVDKDEPVAAIADDD